MKIAFMTNNYKPFVGGVPISIERLCNGLRELGHEVIVFAPTYENQEKDNEVYRYKSLTHKFHKSYVIPNCLDFNIIKEFKKQNFDLIHVHHPLLIGNVAKMLSRIYDIPIVLTYHTNYEQYFHNINGYEKLKHYWKGLDELVSNKVVPHYINQFTKKCDVVIAPTEGIKNLLYDYGVNTHVKVLPTGLSDESYLYCEQEAIRIRELHGKNKHLFCCVARLSKEKNLEYLLNVMTGLKPQANLIIIGEGPMRQELEEKIVELGLEDTVFLIGNVENMKISNYLYASDLFLFSSLSETQGIVLLEAMAVGLPAVALEATGVRDIVVQGYNGYMVTGEEENMVCLITEVLSNVKKMVDLKKNALFTAFEYKNEQISKGAESIYFDAIEERVNEKQWISVLRQLGKGFKSA